MREHNIKQLLDMGVCVTINSDDPAYFGGYMNENFIAAQRDLDMSKEDLFKICMNTIAASFISNEEKGKLRKELEEYYHSA